MLVSKLKQRLRPQPAADPVPAITEQLHQLAARLETHTFNLAEHEAQLRDESMRRIVNEVRANTAFLADSVVAIERAEARRADRVHDAVRPIVWRHIAPEASDASVILADHIDPVLVEELLVDGRRVIVVDPALDAPASVDLTVNHTPIGSWHGPSKPADAMVWVLRGGADVAVATRARAWLAPGGKLIVASPVRLVSPDGFAVIETCGFRSVGASFRRAASLDECALFVVVLQAS